MAMDIKPIETRYKGVTYRSRTEARWAIFFDMIGAPVVYEKEGYDLGPAGWYLPDFWVPIVPEMAPAPGSGYWLEVKGRPPSAEEKVRCAALAVATGHVVYLVAGPPGDRGDNGTWKWYRDGRLVHDGDAWPWHTADDDTRNFFLVPELHLHGTAGLREKDCHEAVDAARSARFEHGEAP